MGQFQLDHSDCDAIMDVVRREELPVYLAHAQVVDRVLPPTTYYVAVGIWWTDLFSMSENYNESRSRPRENRPAAYFNTTMFNDTQAFIDHLNNNGPDHIKTRMKQDGYPGLYR